MQSVTEVSFAGEDHCQTSSICSGDHFFIADRTAGLNNCSRTSFDCGVETVGEWEERI
jgi:hypothetical protein